MLRFVRSTRAFGCPGGHRSEFRMSSAVMLSTKDPPRRSHSYSRAVHGLWPPQTSPRMGTAHRRATAAQAGLRANGVESRVEIRVRTDSRRLTRGEFGAQ